MSTHDCSEHRDLPLDPPDRWPLVECASCEREYDPADGRTCGDCGDEPWICDDCAPAHRARHAPEKEKRSMTYSDYEHNLVLYGPTWRHALTIIRIIVEGAYELPGDRARIAELCRKALAEETSAPSLGPARETGPSL